MIHVSDAVGGVIRYVPNLQATGLTFTGTGETHPCYNSHYVKVGKLVTFSIEVNCSTITNFGTGQIKLSLPFAPFDSGKVNHFAAWAWADPSQPADALNGHVVMVADHLPNSQTLDLHWIGGDTPTPKPVIEHIFYQGYPITLTTTSKIYVNGTYISA